MSRKISEITVAGQKVIVRELTVTQVDSLISSIKEQAEPTTLDWMFAEDYLPESVMIQIIDQPLDELLAGGDIAPSELEPIYLEAMKLNPFLVKAVRQMRKIGSLLESLARQGLDPMFPGSGRPPST